MTGKPGASGGAREGAGRPLSTYKGNQYTGETPIEKLWTFLAERHGEEAATEAHLFFNEQKRIYEKQKIAERKVTMATLQEAVQAKSENKVVLADLGGRRVTINSLVQNETTGEWSVRWSHSDYPESRWDTVSEDQQFIIRGVYGRYR